MTLLRIIKILTIRPFEIETLWTNGEFRLIDFSEKMTVFAQSERYRQLTDFEIFNKVELSESNTLCWKNIQFKNVKGNLAPLTFDPDVLYAESTLLEPKPIIEIDSRHEFTQADYARRKGIDPAKVRIWVKRGRLKSRYLPHLGITLVLD